MRAPTARTAPVTVFRHEHRTAAHLVGLILQAVPRAHVYDGDCAGQLVAQEFLRTGVSEADFGGGNTG